MMDPVALAAPWVLMLLGLGLVIFVHELGHFLVAKWAGVKVERFSLGFGPRLVAIRRGETEYCLSAIPLGGYVKMAGETPEDEKHGDPREFAAQPARWRAAILLAGVGMNTVAAVPLLATALLLGGTFRANQSSLVGSVSPGSAAARAGLAPGDRILTVNGERISRWIEVEALGVGAKRGLSNAWPDRIGEFSPEALPAFAGARAGDTIVAVNGTSLADVGDVADAVRDNPGGTLTLTLRRDSGDTYDIRLPIARQTEYRSGLTLRPAPDARIGEVAPGSPAAKAGLAPGDLIRRVGDHAIDTWEDLRRAVQDSREPVLNVTVLREGREVTVPVAPEEAPPDAGPIRLGVLRDGREVDIPLENAAGGRMIGVVQAQVIAAADGTADVAVGDVPLAVRFVPETGTPADWPVHALAAPSAAPGRLALTLLRGGARVTATVALAPRAIGHVPFPPAYVERVHPPYALAEAPRALAAAAQEGVWILRFSVNRLRDLGRALTRGETHVLRQISGPLGIGAMTYVSVQQGYSPYFWMLGLISLSLALMNILPIPLLDGGHLLFLAVEKIRGKPVSDRVQIATQYTALAALLSLVLLATWNDINIIDQLRRLSE